MLVYDSTGKLVDLQGPWNSGNLPLGYYATPNQFEQATGLTAQDYWNPLGKYNPVTLPEGTMGYAWDYNTGRQVGHRQQAPIFIDPTGQTAADGGSPFSPTFGGGYTQMFTPPPPNASTQYGQSASLVDPEPPAPVQPLGSSLFNPAAAVPDNAPQTVNPTLAAARIPQFAMSTGPASPPPAYDANNPSPFFDPTHRQVGQDAQGNPVYRLIDEGGMIKQWSIANGQIVGLQDVGRATAPGDIGGYGAQQVPPSVTQNPVAINPTTPAAPTSSAPVAPGTLQPTANELKFSFNPLVDWLKNPLNPPKPKDPFGSNIQGNSGGGGGGAEAAPSATNMSLQGEGANTLAAQVALMPQIVDQYSRFAPQIAATDVDTLRQTLFGAFDAGAFERDNPGFLKAYQDLQAAGEIQGWTPVQFAAAYTGKNANDPTLLNYYSGGVSDFNQRLTDISNQQTIASNTALRQGNVNDAAALGGQALNTLKGFNPNLYGALNQAASFVGGPAASGTSLPQTTNPLMVSSAPAAPGSNTFVGPVAGPASNATGAQGGIGVSSYQTALGGIFNQGPRSQTVSGATINPTNVSATYNPLLSTINAQAQNLGPTALGGDLASFGRQQLALGGSLSDEQRRNATQAAREAYAARGLINSNGAIAQEILNRDAYSQQLLNQRFGMASNANQLEQAQQGLNNAFLFNAAGANATQGGQNLQAAMANQGNQYQSQLATAQLNQAAQQANQGANLQAQQMNQSLGTTLAGMDYSRQQQNFSNIMANAQLQASNAFDPFATITTAGTANQGTNSGMYGLGGAASSGALGNQGVMSMFDPFNAYASDYYNTQKNAAWSNSASAANNKSATNAAMIGGGASIAAAAIIAL